MMKTTKLLNVAALCLITLTLNACKDYEGNLQVSSLLQLVKKDGVTLLEAGNYRGKLIADSKTKVTLEVVGKDGKKQKYAIKVPKGALEKSEALLTTPDNGQSYNIAAGKKIETHNSDTISSIESCTYYTTEYRCRILTSPRTCQTVKECDPANPSQCKERTVCEGGDSREVCGNESVSHSGIQDVEYYDSTTTEKVAIKFLHPANGVEVARFEGAESDSNRIYLSHGVCR